MEFDYIIDKINSAQVIKSPWPYTSVDNFLKPEHLQLLKDDWHSIDWKEHEQKKQEYIRSHEEPNWVRDYFSTQQSKQLTEFLSSKDVFDAMEKKFSTSVDWNDIWIKRMYKRDDPFAVDESHTDVHCGVNSYMVLQIFFPDQEYKEFGTVLQEYYDQPISESVELPLKINSANMFVNTPDTWHTTKPGDRLRKSYIQRFVFKEGHEPESYDHYKK
jgi:hypothetical protein